MVELIIVVLILGILAGVATVVFSETFRAHREAVAKSNLNVIKSSVQIYRTDHNGLYPDNILSTSGTKDGLDYYLDEALNKILRDPNEPYKYSLTSTPAKLTFTVTGPNSFREEIVITK